MSEVSYRPPASVYRAYSGLQRIAIATGEAAVATRAVSADEAAFRLDDVRKTLAEALARVDAALGDLRPEPDTFKQLGEVASLALSDGLASAPAVGRLVPRFPGAA